MKLFVWDFHGTLEKGNEEAAIEFSNLALEILGFKQRFDKEHVNQLYGLKWYQYFEYLLPEYPHETHLKLQEISFSLNDTHWHIVKKHIRPNDYSLEVLTTISQKHDQILISNTTRESLELFLPTVGMDKIFTQKYFGVDGHSKGVKATKSDIAKEYLLGKSYEKIIVIGDSIGDMNLGNSLGATKYLYIHPGKTHRDAEADFKISDLREVLKEV